MRTINRLSLSLFLSFYLAPGLVAQIPPPGAASRVMDAYLAAQRALAQDSLVNVPASGQAILLAVRSDNTAAFPADIARQAELLANATRLAEARKAFRPLSDSLLAHFKVRGFPAGRYYEMYCPTVKATWLQTSAEARNPYLGWRARTTTWGWSCVAALKATFEGPPAPAIRGS